MSVIPFVVTWCMLAIVVLVLALYRAFSTMHTDEMIHLGPGAERMIPKQVELFRKLDLVDTWGETLTLITVLGGILLAAAFLYNAWPWAWPWN